MELHNRNAFIGRWAVPVLVSVVLLVSIWVGSLTHHRGLVRTDSSYYLRLAAFFVEASGLILWATLSQLLSRCGPSATLLQSRAQPS